MHSTSRPIRTLRALPALRRAALAVCVLCAATAAQAQSNVTLYGLIDLSAGSFKSPGSADSMKGVESGNMSTSYLGFRGTEDLGGGLSAQFAIETFMRNDTGASGRFGADAFWARSSWVGLAGGFGSIALGRNTTSLFVNTLIFNAFGDSFGFSPAIRHYFTSGTTTGDTGWNDSVKYASPKFGGLTFTGHIAAGEANGGRNHGLSALYFGGPVGLGLAWQEVKKGATTDDTTTWQVSGSLEFKPVKLYAQYGKVDNDTTNNSYDILGVGGDVALGQGKLLAQYGEIKPDIGAKRKTLTVGYDYFMSKRTDLYAAYMSDKINGLSSGSSYAVGIRHRF